MRAALGHVQHELIKRPDSPARDLQSVLDGDIDAFIERYLLMWADKRKKLEDARLAAKN
jgi:hypothetical protein